MMLELCVDNSPMTLKVYKHLSFATQTCVYVYTDSKVIKGFGNIERLPFFADMVHCNGSEIDFKTCTSKQPNNGDCDLAGVICGRSSSE